MFKGRKDSDLLGVIANDWMVGVDGEGKKGQR